MRKRCIDSQKGKRMDLHNIRRIWRPLLGPEICLVGDEHGVSDDRVDYGAEKLVSFIFTEHLKKAPETTPVTRQLLDSQDAAVRQRMIQERRSNKLTRGEILKLKFPEIINISEVILPE